MRHAVLILCFLLLAHPVSAGTELAVETRQREKGEDRVRQGKALLDGERLRIDTDGGRRSLIYHADRGVVWVVDHKKESYLELRPPPPAELSRELDERLAGLSPEVRGLAEQVLGAGSPGGEVEVRATDVQDQILDIPCTGFEVVQADETQASLCQASFADAQVDPGSFASLRRIQELLEGALGGMVSGSLREEGIAALQTFGIAEGVPLRVRTYRNGQLDSETQVTRIEQKSLETRDFEVPEGYRARFVIDIRGGDVP